MVQTILSSPLFTEVILPFLLVFVVIFAILQKTEILGKGKKQIDAIVALVIGLLVVSFGYATNIITSLIPFLAISVIAILVFMILYGMSFGAGSFKMHSRVMIAIGVLAALGVVLTLLVATGTWSYIYDWWYSSSDNSTLVTNIIFVGLVVVVLYVAMSSGSDKPAEKK